MMPGMDTAQSISAPSYSNQGASNPANFLTSASSLFAHYLNPNSPSNNQQSQSAGSQSNQQAGVQNNFNGQNLMSPQQQAQYTEFASILDSMVAQTGLGSSQRSNQMLGNGVPQNSQGQQAFQSMGGNMMGLGDNDMVASNNIQTYATQPSPASGSNGASNQAQASQKSSMVSLAEQMLPGAQFNKLVSFPFSLTNNDDPSKDGRLKVTIPYVSQHIKRSDQGQPRSQQQYLNPSYSQYVPLMNSAQQSQMIAQSSQQVPSIVSPQSPTSSSSIGSIASSVSSQSQASPMVSSSSSSSQSSSSLLSSPSVSSASSNNPSSSISSVASISSQSNSRPGWSMADLQSSSSSSKLIPLQSSSSADSVSSSQN